MANFNHLAFSSDQIFYVCVKVIVGVAVEYGNRSVCLIYSCSLKRNLNFMHFLFLKKEINFLSHIHTEVVFDDNTF